VLQRLGPALLVGAGYFVTGKLALLLAIPPGYASAAWPPSGIALAGVLLGGWRVVPGIVAGSFLLNLSTGFAPGSPLLSFGVPAVIALGAAAQAALGSWLIRLRGYPPNVLTAGISVVPLLVLGGPVTCTLNATLAVGTLWLAGRIPGAAVPYNWWTWWVGDSIGVLLFAPLVLVWAVRPWGAWLRRQVYVTAPLALLFVAVVALFVFVSRREQSRIEAGFQTLASDIHQALRVRLDNTLAVLTSIEGLYLGSEQVTVDQFEAFGVRQLRNLEGATALAWSPRVTESQRAAFERRGRSAGIEDYAVTEFAPDRSLQAAEQRPWYVPVEALAPRAGNTVVLGFDLASEPVRLAALEEARDTGQAVASGVIPLAHTGERGLLVVLPVYALGAPADTVDARRRSLRGYAIAAFTVEGLFGGIAHRAGTSGLDIALSDLSELGAPAPLYGVVPAPSGLHQEFAVSFARRTWRLEIGLGEHAVVARRSWEAWVVLASGMMLAALLGVLLLAGVGHAAQIEKVVAERTEALRRTGGQLARSNRELEQYACARSARSRSCSRSATAPSSTPRPMSSSASSGAGPSACRS
jgi:CHASE1-domain containing sensor protein